MKAVILCAGRGSRLRPVTYSLPKPLLPVLNQPVVGHLLEQLAQSGINEVGMVVPPDYREFVHILGDGSSWNVQLEYIVQEQPLGLAHAVLKTRAYTGGSPFLLLLGDNLLHLNVASLLQVFIKEQALALVVLKRVRNPERYGVALLSGNRIIRLLEKPVHPPDNRVIAGAYILTEEIFRAIEEIKPSSRGELEITDALQNLIEQGHLVIGKDLRGKWQDVGSIEGLLKANRTALRKLSVGNQGMASSSNAVEVIGPVQVGPRTKIMDSTLKGPLVIGADCLLIGMKLGPNATIGDRCKLLNSKLSDSLVMGGASILNWPRPIRGSVIGRYACMKGKPAKGRLLIGDNSIIEL